MFKQKMLRATQVPMQEFICDLRFRHLKVWREADFSCPRAVNKKAVTYHKWCGNSESGPRGSPFLAKPQSWGAAPRFDVFPPKFTPGHAGPPSTAQPTRPPVCVSLALCFLLCPQLSTFPLLFQHYFLCCSAC